MAKQPPNKAQGQSTPKQLDAIQMLKADHKQVHKLFERFHAASGDEQASIARRLLTELEIHTALEEELFYPALRSRLQPTDAFDETTQGNGLDLAAEEEDEELDEEGLNGMELDADEDEESDEELITTAYEEHQAAKDLIEQLRTLDPKEPDYEEVFNELEEAVIEHITGEEDVLFPLAQSELDVQALGLAMQRRRDDLLSSLAA
jgi:hemerythrin superfamily protein